MTSPTENTEGSVDERKLIDDILLHCGVGSCGDPFCNKGNIGVDESNKQIRAIIARSNHQAVQAFGEKVLGEAVPSDTTPAGEPEYVPVSVITSLMEEGVK